MNDLARILASAFLRAAATGLAGVALGLHLVESGFTPGAIGAVVGAGLAGCAAAACFATRRADAHGRRRTLFEMAFAGAAGGLALLAAPNAALAALASFAGMMNGMGRDRGASLVVEQAILPQIVGDGRRTRVLAGYNVLQDSGHAIGALLAAAPRPFLVYAGLLAAVAVLALTLSPAVESAAHAGGVRPPVSPATRRLLARISSLFALDSLGGGFLTTALLSVFFVARFDASPAAVAALFFGARVLNALSHLGAAWLARRIGLVNTMVFTHIPSSLLLVTVPFAPSFEAAAVLFLLREGLVEMDVPTRQSYVLAIVAPHERTLASGVTSLVRMAAWAVGPFLAGPLLHAGGAGGGGAGAAGGSVEALALPLIVGAALKITYDVLLWRAFRAVRPPEEMDRAEAPSGEDERLP